MFETHHLVLISFPCPLFRSLPPDVVLGVGAMFVGFVGLAGGWCDVVTRQPELIMTRRLF